MLEYACACLAVCLCLMHYFTATAKTGPNLMSCWCFMSSQTTYFLFAPQSSLQQGFLRTISLGFMSMNSNADTSFFTHTLPSHERLTRHV